MMIHRLVSFSIVSAAVLFPQQPTAYFEHQVDTPVSIVGAVVKPIYPGSLVSIGTQGQVAAQFVIDSTGKFDKKSFKALKTTGPLFTEAVITALSAMKFSAAIRQKIHVAQVVQQMYYINPPPK